MTLLAAPCLAAIIVAVAIWRPWHTAAALPMPDLSTVHPRVAAAVRSESETVLQSPNSASCWGAFGMLLMAHSFQNEALRSFEQAAILDPEDFRWEFYQGQLLLDSDLEQAISHFQRASTQYENHLPLLIRLCDVSLRLGDVAAAAGYIERAANLESENPYVLLLQGRVAVAATDLDAAERHFATAAASPDWYPRAAYVELLKLAHRTENLELGRHASDQLTRWPETARVDIPDPYLTAIEAKNVLDIESAQQADRLLASGYGAEAAQTFEQISLDRPELARPALNLGRALMMQGRNDEALRIFEEVTTRFPDDAMAWFTLAHMFTQRQDAESALECYRRAIEIKPDFADAHFSLGLLLEQAGDKEAAKAAYSDAVRSDPGMAQAHLALGVLLQNAGELNDAIFHMRAAMQLVPGDPIPASYLERALQEQDAD